MIKFGIYLRIRLSKRYRRLWYLISN